MMFYNEIKECESRLAELKEVRKEIMEKRDNYRLSENRDRIGRLLERIEFEIATTEDALEALK